jgi:hypothetical protein
MASAAAKYSNRDRVVAAHAFEVGLALAGGGAQIPGLGPSSGPLSRKNAFGRAQCRLPGGQQATC